MKIDVVATPRKSAIEPGTAAVVADLSRHLPSLSLSKGENRVAVPVATGESADWSALANELGAAFAGWENRSVDVAATVEGPDETGAAASEPSSVAAAWTPESAKLRDLNGSAANAALPKVLAGLAASTTEVPAVSESSFGAAKKPFRPRSVVVTSSANATIRNVVALSRNRYAALNPGQGSIVAAVESLRELACRGASPLGIAQNISIGIPTTAESFRGLIASVRGLAEFSASLKIGSLGGSIRSVDRTTVIDVAAIGVIEHARTVEPFVNAPGSRLVFLGEAPSEIGGSEYLRAVHGLSVGDAPAVNFGTEQKLHDVLNTLVKAGIVTAARDVSAGGLLSAICAMLLGGEKPYGASLDLTTLGGARADALLFGESQGRVVITVPGERVGTVLSEAHMRGVSAALIGEVTDRSALVLKTRSLETEWSLAALIAAAGN